MMYVNLIKFISLVFLFFLIFTFLHLTSIFLLNKTKIEYKNLRTIYSESNISTILGASDFRPANKFQYFVWLPHFDFRKGLESALQNKSSITEIHYAGVSLDEIGGIKKVVNFDIHLSELQRNEFNIGLNIFSNNPSHISYFINDQEKMVKFILSISKYTAIRTININFEKLNPADTVKFLQFLTYTRETLNRKGIKLFLTVYPKTDTNSMYTLNSVNDISLLTSRIDRIILMFYDYKIINSSSLKYNSPTFWINEVLGSYTKIVSLDKISAALPLYAYEYENNGNITRSHTYNSLKISNSDIKFDTISAEKYFVKNNSEIYFQDSETLKARKDIIRKYGISEIFYWRIGDDGNIGFD